ncbi:MAG: hypothetical protein Q9227_004607 [Pyrenula ochraceoflavens]
MTEYRSGPSTTTSRLTKVTDFLTGHKTATTIPWDPDSTKFPQRKDLPSIPGAPPEAAWVWGPDDQLGRINLLTPTRIKAASSLIKTGELVPLDLPLDVPATPGFGREKFVHSIKPLTNKIAYDDLYTLNTQSGSQWDGFRHFAHIPTETFYNGTKEADIVGPTANKHKCSMHHWAAHGFTGRGVLLDYRGYAQKKGIQYDPFKTYSIAFSELVACGKDQGLDIRPAAQGGDIQIGDILLIRSGFVERYYSSSTAEREEAALRGRHSSSPDINDQSWAGVEQSQDMLTWLHDCYFAAVGGDAPAFECWPKKQDYHLHEYLLPLWGCPIGEMIDCERLAAKCRERGQWTFFMTSAPANVPGGVGTHPNATAIF